MKEKALLIDPDNVLQDAVQSFLRQKGYEVERVSNESEALAKIGLAQYSLLFYVMSNQNELAHLKDLKSQIRSLHHLLVAGPNNVASAVSAMQAGAHHYWALPLEAAHVENYFNESHAGMEPAGKRYRREEALLQIIKEIALTMELDGLVNILVDSAMELTGAEGGALLLLDERSNLLITRAVRGVSGNESQGDLFGLAETQYHEILDGRKPVTLKDPVTSGIRKVRALIAAPIWFRGEPLGLLVNAKFAGTKRSFSNDDFKVFSLLIDEISGAVHNAVVHYRTKELTIKDDLTEAYNRRYFEKYLEDEFMRAKRYGSNLSLIFFDVDNLKEVNMQHGHLVGSKTLQEVARRMILTVRGIDKVVRYGGDEFCVVLPETDTQGAYQVADRIRNIVASKPVHISDTIQFNITGSIGIASFPSHAQSKDELVRQADKAMFVIKNRSKNAIAIAEASQA